VDLAIVLSVATALTLLGAYRFSDQRE
jgi:hypothetical protein